MILTEVFQNRSYFIVNCNNVSTIPYLSYFQTGRKYIVAPGIKQCSKCIFRKVYYDGLTFADAYKFFPSFNNCLY